MHNISKLVLENKQEAYDIVKANGGKIEFVDDIIHNNPDDDEEDDWDGDPCEQNIPWAVGNGCDMLIDAAILAVRCGEKENELDFLVYDNENYNVMGWLSCSDFAYTTENAVYEHIGENYNK